MGVFEVDIVDPHGVYEAGVDCSLGGEYDMKKSEEECVCEDGEVFVLEDLVFEFEIVASKGKFLDGGGK
jgi:hypothetical protein